MDKKQHIQDWYTRIQVPTYDDIEDLRVMLLDMHDNADAHAAIDGISNNLLENGWNEELMLLLTMGCMPNVEPEIMDKSMLILVLFLIMYDDTFRLSKAVIDSVLEIISYPDCQDQMFQYLSMIDQTKNAFRILDFHSLDIHHSLLYELVSAKHPEH